MHKRFFPAILIAGALFSLTAGRQAAADEPEKNAADTPPAKSAFTAAQKEEVRQMIKDFLVKNPEVLFEAMEAGQKRAQADQQKTIQENAIKYKDFLTSAETPTGGNPKGTKVIVEFFDYNCGWCKRVVDDLVKVTKEDSNVKIYFKDYPILAPSSSDAARCALAADKQGKYYEFHVALMKSPLPREKDTYKKIAGDLKLDVAKLEKDAEGDQAIRDTIEKNTEMARKIGINGTPGFVINGIAFPGALSYEMMKKSLATGAPDTAPQKQGGG